MEAATHGAGHFAELRRHAGDEHPLPEPLVA